MYNCNSNHWPDTKCTPSPTLLADEETARVRCSFTDPTVPMNCDDQTMEAVHTLLRKLTKVQLQCFCAYLQSDGNGYEAARRLNRKPAATHNLLLLARGKFRRCVKPDSFTVDQLLDILWCFRTMTAVAIDCKPGKSEKPYRGEYSTR